MYYISWLLMQFWVQLSRCMKLATAAAKLRQVFLEKWLFLPPLFPAMWQIHIALAQLLEWGMVCSYLCALHGIANNYVQILGRTESVRKFSFVIFYNRYLWKLYCLGKLLLVSRWVTILSVPLVGSMGTSCLFFFFFFFNWRKFCINFSSTGILVSWLFLLL